MPRRIDPGILQAIEAEFEYGFGPTVLVYLREVEWPPTFATQWPLSSHVVARLGEKNPGTSRSLGMSLA